MTDVEPLDGFRLRLTFDDASVREVDLTGELWGPMSEELRAAGGDPRRSVGRGLDLPRRRRLQVAVEVVEAEELDLDRLWWRRRVL